MGTWTLSQKLSGFQHFLGMKYSTTFSVSFICHNFRLLSAVLAEYWTLFAVYSHIFTFSKTVHQIFL